MFCCGGMELATESKMNTVLQYIFRYAAFALTALMFVVILVQNVDDIVSYAWIGIIGLITLRLLDGLSYTVSVLMDVGDTKNPKLEYLRGFFKIYPRKKME